MSETTMNQAQAIAAQPSEPRHGAGGSSAFWLLALPVLYVLSIGPMAKIDKTLDLTKNQPGLERGLEILYAPVVWCAKHSPTFKSLLLWYWRDVWHVKM
jgi:hypothetical protein